MGLIQGMHHVALKCSDVEEFEKAVEFYTKVLGLRVKRRWGEGSDSGIMIDTGEGLIEIFAKNDGPLPQGTIRHFALKVKDAPAMKFRGIHIGWYVNRTTPEKIEELCLRVSKEAARRQ